MLNSINEHCYAQIHLLTTELLDKKMVVKYFCIIEKINFDSRYSWTNKSFWFIAPVGVKIAYLYDYFKTYRNKVDIILKRIECILVIVWSNCHESSMSKNSISFVMINKTISLYFFEKQVFSSFQNSFHFEIRTIACKVNRVWILTYLRTFS